MQVGCDDARLDVARDYHRIAQLSFVVRYGAPMFLHGLFSAAFVYNVGMPAMARGKPASLLGKDGPGVQLYIANPMSHLDLRNTVDWMTSPSFSRAVSPMSEPSSTWSRYA